MIQQTSLDAYMHIQKTLGERQLKVYLCLEDLQSANNTIIAKKLHLPINQVTPRINELRKMGLVITDCMRECPITRRLTYFWRVRVPQEMKVDNVDKSVYSHMPIFPMEQNKEVSKNSI